MKILIHVTPRKRNSRQTEYRTVHDGCQSTDDEPLTEIFLRDGGNHVVTDKAVLAAECLPVLAKINARYITALKAAVQEAFSQYGRSMVGLVLCGSVARGTAGPKSDIDLVVFLEPPGARRQAHDIFEGICVDVVALRELDAVTALENRDDAGLITKMRDAIILYDHDGRATSIVKMGRQIYKEGTPAMTADEAGVSLNALHELFASIRNIPPNDVASINHCLAVGTFIIIDLITRLRRAWASTKPAHQIEQIRMYAPELASAVRALSTPDSPIILRVQILKGIISRLEAECRDQVKR